ncbi:hypothetical protein ES692_03905 [Psychroserpens burtonensis]|uniref:Uncharacterized protein n=1 Tax=Psychroserpens burtonensis TaxID=49278 RepID=A0A5C7BEU8_9FLAO|nr:hypothetical protein [Psychroserpens burtonensis]TXE19435.1 hypothetical protein ES692_03905 [Psychroserpens burtonensis]
MNKLQFNTILFLLLSFSMFSQVGIGTTTPAGGSILDVTSTDKGVLVPSVDITNSTTIAPITGGAPVGLLVWNTNSTTGVGFHYWDGNDWIALGATVPRAVTNGLNFNTPNNDIRLGGNLIEDTTIISDAFNLVHNLNSTGDFHI